MNDVRTSDSRRIAGLLGPTVTVLTLSESPWIQPHLYDSQIPPVVYLSGALFFVAGLAIVRIHNLWVAGWPVLVTVLGWLALLLGLVRMFGAGLYPEQAPQNVTGFAVFELLGTGVGIFLTFKAYGPGRRP